VIHKSEAKCKREHKREVVRFMREENLRNQEVSVFIAHEKIVLDNPLADTYHTAVLCQRFARVCSESLYGQPGQSRSRLL
jgi:hypothetical protein